VAARLDALILCDFAQVREGLLFVQSGGLTRLMTRKLPATFNCHVAMLVAVSPDVALDEHNVVMRIKHAPSATALATVKVDLHPPASTGGLMPGESRIVPVVVPLSTITFRSEGVHDLQVSIDDHLASDLSFHVSVPTS